jgi:hypothetical protein
MVSKFLSLLAVPLAGVAAQVSWPTLQNISLTQYNISGFEADRLGKYSYQFEYFDHYTGFIGACAGSGDSSKIFQAKTVNIKENPDRANIFLFDR